MLLDSLKALLYVHFKTYKHTFPLDLNTADTIVFKYTFPLDLNTVDTVVFKYT